MQALLAQTELVNTCGSEPGWICERLFEATDGNKFVPPLVDAVVSVAVILLVAWIASLLARRYFARVVARVVAPDRTAASRHIAKLGDRATTMVATPMGIDNVADPRRDARVTSISGVVGSTSTVIIWSIALVMALGELGVNLAPMIAGLGFAGVALGFGAQSLVKDCIAGLFMLVEDQYGIGDVVDLDEAVGTVEKISLRTTVLRGVDGTVWHVPNGVVQRVGNSSQLWSVALIDVNVAYDCDLAAARQVIIDCAIKVCASDEWADATLDAPELLGVEALGVDGITVRVTVKTQPGTQWGLQRALREALKTALDDAGIEIPFPQRTIWVRRDDDSSLAPTGDDPVATAT
ncbi:MAG TPA: mechanosensitive ion channel family protein [Ilumatobacteraceae bacterium]|nr:mechanosensitive ion channel family protein [Ilumatobacteraceae bacterium]